MVMPIITQSSPALDRGGGGTASDHTICDQRREVIAIVNCSEGDDLEEVWHSLVVVCVAAFLQDSNWGERERAPHL